MATPPVNGPRPDGRSAGARAPMPRGGTGSPGATPPGGSAPGKAPAQERMPPRRSWLTFLLILLVNYALVRMLFPRGEQAVTVPYTLFKQEVTKRNVERIYSRGEGIRGRFRSPITYPSRADTAGRTGTADTTPRAVQPRSVRIFTTTLPSFVDPGFETLLISNGVEISAEPID